MNRKRMNYIGEIITDVEYHGLGDPKNFLEVRMDVELPFKLYCRTDLKDWEEVTEEERVDLVRKYEETKSKYSKSDYRYYTMDFYLASLGKI